MTTICENVLTTCCIPYLYRMIAASRGKTCAIWRPGHGKDTGSALRGQESGPKRNMYHLARGDCWKVTGGAGSQEQDEPANSKERFDSTECRHERSPSFFKERFFIRIEEHPLRADESAMGAINRPLLMSG